MSEQTIEFIEKSTSCPIIYAFSDVHWPGLLKVGYTTRDVLARMKEHYPTAAPERTWKVEGTWPAMRADGSIFMDHEVHRALEKKGVRRISSADDPILTEWFACTIEIVEAAVLAVQNETENIENRTASFAMRPEQAAAVERTAAYYQQFHEPGRTPKFLWNAKMRFGKTFAAYQLAKCMGLKKIFILTFKPAVQSAWKSDLLTHIDFEGWQFISRDAENAKNTIDKQYKKYIEKYKDMPLVCFGSFQDFLGKTKDGMVKTKNEWVHEINWDLVIFDEYHYGAWRENAKRLFEKENEDEIEEIADDYCLNENIDESFLPITTNYYLFLSGTPFRAIHTGEFIEDQIYNWTYSDEQKAKSNWKKANNPYEDLPQMILLTYKLPNSVENIALNGEFNEFDLNVFFSAKGEGAKAEFVYKDNVQKWLNLIRGQYTETAEDELRQGKDKPVMPFSDTRLLSLLNHTVWFLPNVASCHAMANLLKERQNIFYHDYEIVVCAGVEAGIGVDALKPVEKVMYPVRDGALLSPLQSKSITLSCGKLMTGVTVKPWMGILMLRNLKSPETYFQAAFRVQSPWTIKNDLGRKEIVKQQCFVFDFDINRSLRQLSDYCCQLNVHESNPEKKVGEFIHFLPVLAYDGSAMKRVNAAEILDIAMSGTSSTLLAKRWQSPLLVNVDNDTLTRLQNNPDAMRALEQIEAFRNLNKDIETIINKSDKIKKAKRNDDNKDKQKPKDLSDDEKKLKSLRKQIQEKLIKLATRIPAFMYLTDFREYSLKDVIRRFEPDLFKKVTGLEIADFELLCNLNVFRSDTMNDAVYKFKRYEDASLEYTGINRHESDETVGGFDTSIPREDYESKS